MMTIMDKISVLVPTYNHKDYIQRSIDSILMQKTNFNYTIWIADDCSTDGTSEIINNIITSNQNKHVTIRHIISPQNLGIKNKIVHFDNILSSGQLKNQYVAFCSGDDYWINSTKLQEQYNILKENKKAISICDSLIYAKKDTIEIQKHENAIIKKNKLLLINNCATFSQGSSVMFKNIIDWEYFPDISHDDGGFQRIFNLYGDNIYRDIISSVYDMSTQGLYLNMADVSSLINYVLHLMMKIIFYLKTDKHLLSQQEHDYILENLNLDFQLNDRYFIDDRILELVELYKKKMKEPISAATLCFVNERNLTNLENKLADIKRKVTDLDKKLIDLEKNFTKLI